MHFVLCVGMCLWTICNSHVHAAAGPLWNVEDLVNDVKTKPITTLINELTHKATGEFDKIYHQLEGLMEQVSGAWRADVEGVEAELDPKMLSECNCYCRCPHDTVNSKVVAGVKDSVLELKRRVEIVGKSLKDKIHEITS